MEDLPLDELKDFFSKQKGIHTALLFGSFAKTRPRKDSDVDIAILFESIESPTWDRVSRLGVQLDTLCRREVDLLNLNRASPHIAFRAIKEGKIIFQLENRAHWNSFVVKTISMNEDMQILYRKVGRG